jgi:hypothetical protein
MAATLDEQYLHWLYSQTGSTRLTNPDRTYWCLLRQLFVKDFIWIIPNDDNRAEDGKELRREFARVLHVDISEPDWWNMGCSVLEMLVGVSRRLSFESSGQPRVWFWRLLENLGISQYNDSTYPGHEQEINERLDDLIFRTYHPDGTGGLFPLAYPTADQRDVEIWYQLNAYLIERG